MSGPAADEHPTDAVLPVEAFGEEFLRRVLHLERVLESIDRILGTEFALGPIGAGPGRKVAQITATGSFLPCTGEPLDGPEVGYRVLVPVEVDFDLDLRVDSHRFHAEVVVPLRVVMRTVEPLTILWDIDPPTAEDLEITIRGETRRSTVLQKVSGMDSELRRFLLRFVQRELEKPHVRRAQRIDVASVIDGAWPQIAAQFLPNGPEDRAG
ncbi:hypothetical protein [Nocardioides terrisoli]|uniref:hypothetical protein n=1 Tax=Nocardioides terrisoli TaxID=3388267 RepID=UPI00287B6935|nr:hypothetical protein [Nocardioides marmorisolisilvae]